MQHSEWSLLVSDDESRRRAGGRRRYNSWRQFMAQHRRLTQVLPLLREHRSLSRGVGAAIARALNVSRATISRDIAAIFDQGGVRCPTCGGLLFPPLLDRFALPRAEVPEWTRTNQPTG